MQVPMMMRSRASPRLLLLLFLFVFATTATTTGVAVGSSNKSPRAAAAATTTTTQPASLFTRDERKEQDYVWKIIQKSCQGCWSGAMSVYTVISSSSSSSSHRIQLTKPPKSNFRLHIETSSGSKGGGDDDGSGTWSVWNLERTGNNLVVPLRKRPTTRPTQLKIGFKDGIILRIPCRISNELGRIVFEIGFWEPAKMRRTVVAEYKQPFWRKRFSAIRKTRDQWNLKELSIVQTKAKDPQNFVGQTTDKDDIRILPLKAPFQLQDYKVSEFRAYQSESVNLQTMERTKKTRLDRKESRRLYGLVMDTLGAVTDEKQKKARDNIFRQVLPNGLVVSMPRCLYSRDSKQLVRCVFAHFWSQDFMQAVEVEYDSISAKAKQVSLYSFLRSKS